MRVASSTTPTFVDSGLTSDTTYEYQVAAVNAADISDKSQKVTAKTASESSQVNEWKVGTIYQTGDIVSYKGSLYRCRQGHTGSVTWEPDVALSLWIKIS